jgi:DNA-binding GntR family transcriptional regulator
VAPTSSKAEASGAAAKVARARGSGAQYVYDTVRKSILDLTLQPGSPLDEVGLAKEFAMSRTPIREALVRLAAEGLVTTLPNRNTIVSPIDFVRLPVYFEALTLMYRVTTRLAAAHRRQGALAGIRTLERKYVDAVKARDALRMIEANRDFHVAISEAGGNVYFTGLFARLLDEGRRILRLYYQSFDDRLPQQYVEEHDAIVAALAAQDVELADRLAEEHAAQIVRQIQNHIARDTARIALSGTLGQRAVARPARR